MVEAHDSGLPLSKIYLKLLVNVDLNPYKPRFASSVFNATINEFDSPGISVVQLSATDLISRDKLLFQLYNSSSEERRLFHVDSVTGLLTLRISLLSTNTTLYQVSTVAPLRPCSSPDTLECISTVPSECD